LNIKCEELDIDISSGATVELEGSSDEQQIRANSGATYKGKELHTKNSNIKVNSGASAKVYVTEKLKAKAHSGGSVKYYGDPKNFEIDTGFSGSVKKH